MEGRANWTWLLKRSQPWFLFEKENQELRVYILIRVEPDNDELLLHRLHALETPNRTRTRIQRLEERWTFLLLLDSQTHPEDWTPTFT